MIGRGNSTFLKLYHRLILVPKKIDMIPYVIMGRDTIFKENDVTFFENRKKIKFVALKK